MNQHQGAAFLQAQTALMLAEMEMMKATNAERLDKDHSLAYGHEEWQEFIYRWEAVIGHNAALIMFSQCSTP